MVEAKQPPMGISARMDELLSSAGEAVRSGDVAKSIKLSLQAWSLMPEPVKQRDFYPQTIAAGGLVDDFVAAGDASAARIWIKTAYEMYDDLDRRNHYVLMLEGAALHKLGLFDEAYAVFDRIYGFSEKLASRATKSLPRFLSEQEEEQIGAAVGIQSGAFSCRTNPTDRPKPQCSP